MLCFCTACRTAVTSPAPHMFLASCHRHADMPCSPGTTTRHTHMAANMCSVRPPEPVGTREHMQSTSWLCVLRIRSHFCSRDALLPSSFLPRTHCSVMRANLNRRSSAIAAVGGPCDTTSDSKMGRSVINCKFVSSCPDTEATYRNSLEHCLSCDQTGASSQGLQY